jgi:peptidoglycan/LPS O-acetylase OafA/YrhL
MTIPPTTTPTRLRGIDALRGIAALGVVFYHAIEQGEKVLPQNILQYPVRAARLATSAFFCSS